MTVMTGHKYVQLRQVEYNFLVRMREAVHFPVMPFPPHS